jgi:L-ascorbate metabolism protein UlaG (beta-lactamase superfamily)
VPETARALEKRGARGSVGMNVGGFYRRGALRVWCAPAMHSSGFHDGAYGGVACGFVVDDGETRFYHAGDTGLFGDMRAVIRDLLAPHVAAVPIGDRYTMGPEHAARAVEWLGVDVAIPMHYGTFEEIATDPRDFARRVGAAACRVVVPPIDGGVEMRGARLVRELDPAGQPISSRSG